MCIRDRGDAAVIHVGQASRDAQQRTLAAAARTEQHEELAGLNLQRGVVDDRRAVIAVSYTHLLEAWSRPARISPARARRNAGTPPRVVSGRSARGRALCSRASGRILAGRESHARRARGARSDRCQRRGWRCRWLAQAVRVWPLSLIHIWPMRSATSRSATTGRASQRP